MTIPPEWATAVPSAPVHTEPPLAYQWQGISAEELFALAQQLLESVVSAIVETLTGLFVPGGLGSALEQLQTWAGALPVFGDIVAAIVEAITGILDGDLGFLTNWFTDLLGIFGDPTGLGSGTVGLDTLANIPILGPIFAFVNSLIDGILGIFTGSGTGGLSGLLSVFTDIFGIFGSPTGMGTGTIGLDLLANIPLLGPAAVRIQDFLDVGMQALLGGSGTGYSLFDWFDVLQVFPGNNVTGAGGMPNIISTVTTFWDHLTSALRLDEWFDVGMDDVAYAAQATAQSAITANELATVNTNVLGIRTNNSVMGSLERTTVSNFPLAQLGVAATPTNFAVTQAVSSIGLVRMPEADTKASVYWFGSGSASITGFYINIGIMALDGAVTSLFSSGDIKAQLTTGWAWQGFVFPDEMTHEASDVIAVEFQVVGAGTHLIAGLPIAWMPNHPVATTKRGAATRNTGASGPTALNIASGSVTFSGNTPWVGLSRSDVPIVYYPPEDVAFPNSGAYSYTIPVWARVAGTLIDYWILGSGGGGQSGGYFLPGEGGLGGNWVTGTLVYGTDIPLGTTALTGSVAASAAGGLNPFVFDPGDNGTSTTLTGIGGGFSTQTATGGAGGGRAGNNNSTSKGLSPGNRTIAGFTAFGGAQVGANTAGNAPGGGGGAGYPAVGRSSGKGKAWFRARQP